MKTLIISILLIFTNILLSSVTFPKGKNSIAGQYECDGTFIQNSKSTPCWKTNTKEPYGSTGGWALHYPEIIELKGDSVKYIVHVEINIPTRKFTNNFELFGEYVGLLNNNIAKLKGKTKAITHTPANIPESITNECEMSLDFSTENYVNIKGTLKTLNPKTGAVVGVSNANYTLKKIN